MKGYLFELTKENNASVFFVDREEGGLINATIDIGDTRLELFLDDELTKELTNALTNVLNKED